MEKKYSQGFTLTELIIVILLLGFLVLIGISYLRSQTYKGNDARRKRDIREIQVAIEEYEKDHDCYPLPSIVSCNPGTGLKPYIAKIPCDPITGASYYYDYADSSCPDWYRIFTNLENDKDVQAVPGIGPNSSFNFYLGSGNSPSATAGPTSAPQSSGSGSGSQGYDQFYGCKSGACVPIGWDYSRPGPDCDPSYQNSSCYGQCGPAMVECVPWGQ